MPPSRRDGWSALTLPDESPSGAQGFFINTRRAKFADTRVRKALDYAFDFEWTNKNLFYGLYNRTDSFFENSDMKADGKPARRSWRCSSRFAASCRPRCSTSRYSPPVTRRLMGATAPTLREAQRLLHEAGWPTIKDRRKTRRSPTARRFERSSSCIADPSDLRARSHHRAVRART